MVGLISVSVVIDYQVYFWLGFQIYGIDAASGAAVLALDISAGDHVLDLCAAPGMYLLYYHCLN